MARTFVQAGRRRQFTPTLAHKAGDLMYNGGYYGVNQDDVALNTVAPTIARDHMIILDGVWDLPKNGFDASLINAGAKIYAQPTVSATTLVLFQNAASLGAGAVAIGRSWATAAAGASLIRTLLFGPENQY